MISTKNARLKRIFPLSLNNLHHHEKRKKTYVEFWGVKLGNLLLQIRIESWDSQHVVLHFDSYGSTVATVTTSPSFFTRSSSVGRSLVVWNLRVVQVRGCDQEVEVISDLLVIVACCTVSDNAAVLLRLLFGAAAAAAVVGLFAKRRPIFTVGNFGVLNKPKNER